MYNPPDAQTYAAHAQQPQPLFSAAPMALPSSSGGQQMDSTFVDLVKSEMVTLLHKLCAEINVPNPLSLDELAVANPALFAQLRANAEIAVSEILSQRHMSALPPQLSVPLAAPVFQQQQQQQQGWNRKRPLDNPQPQRSYPQHQQQQQRGDSRYSNRFNAGPSQAAHGQGMQQQGQGHGNHGPQPGNCPACPSDPLI